MYVFDMELGEAYSMDFAHLQTYLQQLLIDRASCEDSYIRSLCYALSAYLTHCNSPAVKECEDMLHVIFAYEQPVDDAAGIQDVARIFCDKRELSDHLKPVDLGEDSEQYANDLIGTATCNC